MASQSASSPLWSVLEEKGTNEQQSTVENLAAFAAGMLDRVVETFPTYTLHTAKHAENVVQLMEKLLGECVNQLSALEAACLILSAYYHDIGMAFKPSERGELVEEQPHWDEFLDTFPEAYVAVQKADEVSVDIAEWYCRWRHADRVFKYLNQMPTEGWHWGVVDIREELGMLCKSHNDDVAELQSFDNNYLAQADLQFCAVLLRLADILDFDRSRSPESVYKYLNLERRDTTRKRMSDVEWRKHLCADGFVFVEDRSSPYPIQFIAGPEEPAVEHDVRQFLDVIEDELTQCTRVLRSCSDRWQDFVLPDRIDRSNIRGSGYRYGEYRFTLKQDDVLDLLMGENLYEDPHVFVRELLQNAIDTARHRRHYERYVRGRESFEVEPIRVTEWRDRDGYRWIRFDDWGMGMDLDIIHNHLLKVGSSFYKTSRFKAEMLRAREQSGRDFVPVSRFGIGVLSCFLAGDRVEVSTRHRDADTDPIRLSLNGLHGFYTLQTPNLRPTPIPAPDGEEQGYRREAGTSIAVRLDPRKERGLLDLREKLEEYLLCPPVPVEFEGERIGGDPTVLLDEPWCEHTVIGLPPEMMEQIEEALDYEFERPLQLEIVPIDLTNHAFCSEVKGQFVAASIRPSREWLRYLESRRGQKGKSAETLYIRFKGHNLVLEGLPDVGRGYGLDVALNLILPKSAASLLRNVDNAPEEDWIAHNGIKVPLIHEQKSISTREVNRQSRVRGQALEVRRYVDGKYYHINIWGATLGVLALSDSLRPDISLARNRLVQLSLEVYSEVNLAFLEAKKSVGTTLLKDSLIAQDWKDSYRFLGDLLEDDGCLMGRERWINQPIFRVRNDYLKLEELKELVSKESRVVLSQEDSWTGDDHAFVEAYKRALLQLNVYVELEGQPSGWRLIAKPGAAVPLREGDLHFPPLFLVPYAESDKLLVHYAFYNRNHPFSEWLLDTAPKLASDYPGLLEEIRESLLSGLGHRLLTKTDLLSTLRKLGQVDSEIAPPQEAFPSEEDFVKPQRKDL